MKQRDTVAVFFGTGTPPMERLTAELIRSAIADAITKLEKQASTSKRGGTSLLLRIHIQLLKEALDALDDAFKEE